MLRRFFDVYILKEMNSGKFLNVKDGLVDRLENGSNLFLIAWTLPFICKLVNWNSNKYYFVIKKVWMPNVRIDATIVPDLYKKYFDNKDK